MKNTIYTEVSMLVALAITALIILVVGRYIAQSGIVFIRRGWEEVSAIRINRSLLVGFYLINLGYAGWMMTEWPAIISLHRAMAAIALYCGKILLLIGWLHYFNMIVLQYFINKNQ